MVFYSVVNKIQLFSPPNADHLSFYAMDKRESRNLVNLDCTHKVRRRPLRDEATQGRFFERARKNSISIAKYLMGCSE